MKDFVGRNVLIRIPDGSFCRYISGQKCRFLAGDFGYCWLYRQACNFDCGSTEYRKCDDCLADAPIDW